MGLNFSAACGCHIGSVRSNNEDNFLFLGHHLSPGKQGPEGSLTAHGDLWPGLCLAVFDGMGGEESGEIASFTAARAMKRMVATWDGTDPRSFLQRCCNELNSAVCIENRKLAYGRMGTTAGILFVDGERAHILNIGDSRIYLLRESELRQISLDHVEKPMAGRKKAGLTQNLGIFPDELTLEPHICALDIRPRDAFLLCSDGLTDMVSDARIKGSMLDRTDTKTCVDDLIAAALRQGGRDNISVLMLQIA